MKRLALVFIVLMFAVICEARERRTVSDTAAVKDLGTSSASYQLPNPSDEYCIKVDLGTAWINIGASGVTAATTLTSLPSRERGLKRKTNWSLQLKRHHHLRQSHRSIPGQDRIRREQAIRSRRPLAPRCESS